MCSMCIYGVCVVCMSVWYMCVGGCVKVNVSGICVIYVVCVCDMFAYGMFVCACVCVCVCVCVCGESMCV